MSELLLELNVGLVIVAVDRCVIDVGSSVLIVDDDLTVFVPAILQLLYKEEVRVTSDIARGGCRRGNALGEGARNWGGATGAG